MSIQSKRLKAYYEVLESNELIETGKLQKSDMDKEVRYLSYDSKDMEKDGIFICKGAHFSQEYLDEAIERGAICFVSEIDYKTKDPNFPRIIVTDIRLAMALLGNLFYGEAWKELKLIGITGTKGKSTTAYYIKHILDYHQKTLGKPSSGILSSIEIYDGVIFEESHLTTPETIMLHRHFRNAVNSGIEYLVMEVSSQGLKYHRTMGVHFDVGCFLNIGEDHISPIEHCDFDDYFEAKLKLMEQCDIACVNMDASHGEEVCDAAAGCSQLITFGTKEGADIYGYRIVKKENYTEFQVRTPKFNHEFRLTMPGLFNVENALAAIAICYALHIPAESIYEGLLNAKVAGRMEVFLGDQSKTMVIVDYAHNRMSFDRLFTSTIKEYPDRKIFAIFGCPGKKALARRQELAEIAGRYAKKIFITEEDAGEESVRAISEEIAKYVRREGCPYEIIEDREQAIRRAIEEADDKTVILLTGKGRETRQKRGTEYIDCPSDVDYVLKYLI
ncbi:MAG: UDP-N-acetylmuramoyl-L-alanyl-D-glutamate--2,6-diaminopimelate ligase [Eubacteriales bacterium]|nr:UDP-N-acetylmuramoyl-L-alanyl-D-glutamate--2,6-diaminopimelate ligase [Eubacteriales bacterium]